MKDKISYGIIVFIAFILGGLTMYYFDSNNSENTKNDYNIIGDSVNSDSTSSTCDKIVIVENSSLSSAIEKVFDATVMINTYKNNKTSSTGSGFVYKTDDQYGYIMTNHHVVDGGTKWTLYLSDDTEVTAELLGSDAYLDLAVLRINKNDVKAVAVIGKNSDCKLGDIVFSVGSPLGYDYRGTVTNGIISGLDRLVEVSIGGNGDDWVMEVIQTNAAVNPGNSGGPLVNAEGEVIGVISLKLVENSVEGMGFAIPIEYAMTHVDGLEKGKKIERPLLGISLLNVSDSLALKHYHDITVDETIEEGVVVVEISEGSGASKSELQKGDVITKINGKNVENTAYLKYLLYKYNVGDTVELTYYRDGNYQNTKITLTKNNG